MSAAPLAPIFSGPGSRYGIIVLRSMLVMLVAALAASTAAAAVPWHADLTQAKAASQVSHRPVLILFVASWFEKSINHDKTFLASEEAVDLLTACFEPVRVDIEADPAMPKRLGVSNIPSACVVDADERVLARFDCPETSAGFVAAAGRAAQEAALASNAGQLPAPPPAAVAVPQAPTTESAAVAAVPAAAPAAAEITAQAEPALAPKPPAWPAETASTPLGSPATAEPQPPAAGLAGQPFIEPTPQPQPPAPPPSGLSAALPSWLAPKPATPSVTPPVATAPAAKKPNGLWATVQKPFASLVGKPASPEAVAEPVGEMPSTGVMTGTPGAPMPVGLEGYCAVTLVERGLWVEGRAKWGVRHRGRTYLFAGAEEQRAFLSNPDRYAPGLSGDDPVLAIDSGRQIPGQRQYGVSYRSKVYLFSSPDTQAAFKADPQKYSQRVQVAEQAAGTTVR
jgi:protein disulfide-isomerase